MILNAKMVVFFPFSSTHLVTILNPGSLFNYYTYASLLLGVVQGIQLIVYTLNGLAVIRLSYLLPALILYTFENGLVRFSCLTILHTLEVYSG